MSHADASLIPSSIKSKPEFWAHVHTQLESLIGGEKNWVTNCANASSLIYNSLLAFPAYFGTASNKAVNWCGVYIKSSYFPIPRNAENGIKTSDRMLLGPFCGRPACQFINITPGMGRGVCADAFLQRRTIVVPNVDEYPGHIACDGETKSEIVLPLVLRSGETVGVLDLDCLALHGFGGEDKEGLEKIARLISDSSDW